jgi:hypothetical protein
MQGVFFPGCEPTGYLRGAGPLHWTAAALLQSYFRVQSVAWA